MESDCEGKKSKNHKHDGMARQPRPPLLGRLFSRVLSRFVESSVRFRPAFVPETSRLVLRARSGCWTPFRPYAGRKYLNNPRSVISTTFLRSSAPARTRILRRIERIDPAGSGRPQTDLSPSPFLREARLLHPPLLKRSPIFNCHTSNERARNDPRFPGQKLVFWGDFGAGEIPRRPRGSSLMNFNPRSVSKLPARSPPSSPCQD